MVVALYSHERELYNCLCVYIHIFRVFILRFRISILGKYCLWMRRCCYSSSDDGDSIHGICPSMGPNELLGRYCDYKSFFSLFPVIGDYIVTFLWGGFSVDNPTLSRFFVYYLGFLFAIVGVVALHLVALHRWLK